MGICFHDDCVSAVKHEELKKENNDLLQKLKDKDSYINRSTAIIKRMMQLMPQESLGQFIAELDSVISGRTEPFNSEVNDNEHK